MRRSNSNDRANAFRASRAYLLLNRRGAAPRSGPLAHDAFWVRDAATDGLRPLEKYLDGLPEIRTIQEAILDRARRCDVPVIESGSLDEAIGDVLDVVLTGAERLVRA